MVVGGGITGLVAALRLSQGGSDVVIIEPGPWGGKLQTSLVAGRPVDETADAFLLRVPWALALCHDLDIDGELISPAERSAHVFVDGVRHRFPSGHVLGVPTDLNALARSGLISPAGVERARAELSLGVQATDPGVDGPDVPIGPYLRGRLGDEVVDHLVDPLVGGINAGDTATLSLAAVVPQLDAAARSGDPSLVRSCAGLLAIPTASPDRRTEADPRGTPAGPPAQRHDRMETSPPAEPIFATPMGGMARMVDAVLALIPGVERRIGTVVAVEPIGSRSAGSSPSVATGRGPGAGDRARVVLADGAVIDTDAVVLATPGHVAGSLLSSVSPEAASILAALDHASISMVTIAFDRADLGDVTGASGCLIPRDQGTLVTAVSYATSKWAQLRNTARDDVILRASAGRSGDDRHLDLDDAALTERILSDLDRVIGVTGAPTEVRVGRWPRSFPQYAPGHLDRIDALEAALADTPLRLAGMALRGVGIPACIRSAELAAASLGATWPTRRNHTSP